MSELIERLQRWALLEPDRCRPFTATQFQTREPGKDDRRWWLVRVEADSHSLSRLQASVQAAIVAHDLRIRLENNEEGWFAELRDLDNPRWSVHAHGAHNEAAIVQLMAYVNWLAKRLSQPRDAAIGSSGGEP